jgi:hypothetical protein
MVSYHKSWNTASAQTLGATTPSSWSQIFSLDSRCKGIGVAGNVAGERVVHFLSKSIDLSEDGDGKV